jgi:hypothetical protein
MAAAAGLRAQLGRYHGVRRANSVGRLATVVAEEEEVVKEKTPAALQPAAVKQEPTSIGFLPSPAATSILLPAVKSDPSRLGFEIAPSLTVIVDSELGRLDARTEKPIRVKQEQTRDADSSDGDEPEMFEVDEIVGERKVGTEREFRVRWKGYRGEPDEFTWEPATPKEREVPELVARFRDREGGSTDVADVKCEPLPRATVRLGCDALAVVAELELHETEMHSSPDEREVQAEEKDNNEDEEDYEEIRRKNIERNNKRLAEVGVDTAKTALQRAATEPVAKKKKLRQRTPIDESQRRRSQRARSKPDRYSNAPDEDEGDDDWEEEEDEEEEDEEEAEEAGDEEEEEEEEEERVPARRQSSRRQAAKAAAGTSFNEASMTANAITGAKAAATVTTAPNKPSAAEIVTSQHRGVSWSKARGKWEARIMVDGKQRYLGYFTDESEAAQQYKRAAEAKKAGRPLPAALGRDTTKDTSQHRGVSWHQTIGKWQARISVDGKERHLGCFADESEAARAFDAAHRQHGRPEAHCNFKKRKR